MHHSVIALYNNRKTQSINHTKSIVQSSSKSSWCLHHTKQQPVIALYCEKYNIIPVQGKWNKIKNNNRGTPQQCQHMEILWLPEFSDCQRADINH